MIIFTPNTVISSSDMNLNLADGVDITRHTNNYKFYAYRSNALTTTAGWVATFPIDTEIYDTGSNFNTSTYTYTTPVIGYYCFYGGVTFNSGASARHFAVSIFVDGVESCRGVEALSHSGANSCGSVSTPPTYCTAGQAVTLGFYVDTSSLTVAALSPNTYFGGCLESV